MNIGWTKKVLFLMLAVLLSAKGVMADDGLLDNENGTITDSAKGLMWQQKDDGVERVWNEAVSYCEELDLAGHEDWQLPKIHMLESLIDSSNSPTIAPVFKVKPSYYWSSSVSLNSSKSAKYVNFFYGNTYAYSKDNTYYVICVRDAATEVVPPLTAAITLDASDQEAPFSISFISDTTGGEGPFFYEWDFSDGDTSSMANPKHVFEVAGTYEIMLTVSDNEGAITVATEKLVLPAVEDSAGKTDEVSEDSLLADEESTADLPVDKVESAASALSTVEQSPESEGQAAIMENTEDEKSFSLDADLKDNTDVPGAVDSQKNADDGNSVDAAVAEATFVSMESSEGDDAPDEATSEQKNNVPAKVLEIFASADKKPLTIESSGNGLLAYAFANALGGDADWNKDGKVSARELSSYIPIAVDNLSSGQQKPVIISAAEDFFICSETGTTYLLTVGVNLHQDDFAAQVSAAKDADAVRTGLEGKCLSQKTMILSGARATRTEILQAMATIGGMLTEKDNLIFYYGGASEVNNGKLNMLTYDSIKGMTDFTGLSYGDMLGFFKSRNVKNMLFVFESVVAPRP